MIDVLKQFSLGQTILLGNVVTEGRTPLLERKKYHNIAPNNQNKTFLKI